MLTENTFAHTLVAFRERAKFSQAKLGRECDFDHSYISRLESEQRAPSRHCISILVTVLGLNEVDAETLYRSAGYVGPLDTTLTDPLALQVQTLMQSPATPMPYRMMAAQIIGALVTGSR